MLKVLFSVVQDNEQLKEETGNEVSSAHVSMFLTLMIRGLIRVVKVLLRIYILDGKIDRK